MPFHNLRPSLERIGLAVSLASASFMALVVSGVGPGNFSLLSLIEPLAVEAASPVSPVSPISPISPKSIMTISGAGFGLTQSGGKVLWGDDTDASKFIEISTTCPKLNPTVACIVKWSDKSIQILIPSQSGTNSASEAIAFDSKAQVKVVNSSYQGETMQAPFDTSFYYVPVVTAIKPQAGVAAGGTKVTITGVGFGTSGTVTWGDDTVTTSETLCPKPVAGVDKGCIIKWSATQIQLVTPAHANGRVAISVNGGETKAGVDGAFYYGPVVTGIKPQ